MRPRARTGKHITDFSPLRAKCANPHPARPPKSSERLLKENPPSFQKLYALNTPCKKNRTTDTSLETGFPTNESMIAKCFTGSFNWQTCHYRKTDRLCAYTPTTPLCRCFLPVARMPASEQARSAGK